MNTLAKKYRYSILLGLGLFLISMLASAATPVGNWRTYDDKGNVRSILRFSVNNGVLNGRIIQVLGDNPNSVCTNCKGSLKNKPMKGMVIVWGLKQEGDEWKNGQVLDLDTGKIYGCQLTVSDDNKTLHFHGYSGTPMFGKTIDWYRVK